MSRIVVDTDVASYLFSWHSSAPAWVRELRGAGLVLSFMSVAELRMGSIAAMWGGHRRQHLEQFINGFHVYYADDALCTVWARTRAEARAVGRVVSPQDGWIAATALALDAALATNNRKDYVHVKGLRLLEL